MCIAINRMCVCMKCSATIESSSLYQHRQGFGGELRCCIICTWNEREIQIISWLERYALLVPEMTAAGCDRAPNGIVWGQVSCDVSGCDVDGLMIKP